jgi:phosphosulfolactate synthase (CoM biosynthesis protein A)
MEKQYKKIQAELKQVLPLENVLIKARQLENIHNLIKNNGKNFNLSEEQLSLAERLI